MIALSVICNRGDYDAAQSEIKKPHFTGEVRNFRHCD